MLFSDDYIPNEAILDWFNDTTISTNEPYSGKVCGACVVNTATDTRATGRGAARG